MAAQSRPAAAASPGRSSPGSLAGWVTEWNVHWAMALCAQRQGQAYDDGWSLWLREAGRAGHVAARLRGAAVSSLPGGDPRRQAALALAHWIDGEESGSDTFRGEPAAGDEAFMAASLALGWWAWACELGLQVGPDAGDGDGPSWDALRRGLLACCADVVRLDRTVRGATRPARNPLGRIAAGLMEGVAALQRALQQLEEALQAAERACSSGDGAAAAVRTALWQRLVFLWSHIRRVQAQLVYLPAPEVPPVVYTVLEDVFPGFPVSQSVALTAVPSPLAGGFGPGASLGAGIGIGTGMGLGTDIPLGTDIRPGADIGPGAAGPSAAGTGLVVIGVPLENVENPLAWPLLGGALARRLAANVSGQAGQEDGCEASDALAACHEVQGEADGMALAAFGPSYPLALAAWWAGGRPLMAIPAGLWERVRALLDVLNERGAGLPEARAWCEAMRALHPPVQARPASWDGGPLRREALDAGEGDNSAFEAWRRGVARGWDRWAAAGRTPYGPEDAGVAQRLVEGLAEGRLISALRMAEMEQSAGAARKAGSVGPLYDLLEQVRDVPAGSAQIIAAGWQYYIGLLGDAQAPGGESGGESSVGEAHGGQELSVQESGMFGTTARRLESLDLILMRSLEVAGVHRFYRQAVDEP